MNKKTCGEFYRDAISKYGTDDGCYWAFAAGFVNGQAEKVYIGACAAAMFRPSQDKSERLFPIVDDVCTRYGLVLWNSGIDGEIWICRLTNLSRVKNMALLEKNSAAWHALRAEVCGVPAAEIDFEFHERQGYGKTCDHTKGTSHVT